MDENHVDTANTLEEANNQATPTQTENPSTVTDSGGNPVILTDTDRNKTNI